MPHPQGAGADHGRRARQRAAVTARSANVRSREPQETTPRGRTWAIAVVGVAAVLVAVIGVALLTDGGGSSSPPSNQLSAAVVPGASGLLALADPPASYAVSYRFDSLDGADNADATAPTVVGSSYTTSTEDFLVQRPFRAVITSRAGQPPGGAQQWTITSNLGLSATTTTDREQPTIDTIMPSAAIGDWRLDAVLGDLVADKMFVPRERRTLLGRQCQVYRTGSPLENYDVTAPSDNVYADVCIDASGLVLEQVAMSNGQLLEHLTAVAVDTAPTPVDSDFPIVGQPAAVADGGTSLSPVGGVPADSSYWQFATVPAGYTLQGRYAMQQNVTDPGSVSADGSAKGAAPSTVVATYVDVYVDGSDTIVVHQGPTSAQPTDNTDTGTPATSSSLGA
ncbi:MAG: hypothetical protein ABIQ39_09765, partial [Ilumatobacteraceae bacterium]